jgi:hypothetical protein
MYLKKEDVGIIVLENGAMLNLTNVLSVTIDASSGRANIQTTTISYSIGRDTWNNFLGELRKLKAPFDPMCADEATIKFIEARDQQVQQQTAEACVAIVQRCSSLSSDERIQRFGGSVELMIGEIRKQFGLE